MAAVSETISEQSPARDFFHQHAAHCESGVMAHLLGHAGLPLSEAAAFGLSASLAFAHLPMIRINEQALTSYRMPPGHIVRGLEKRLGIRMRRERFRDPLSGMAGLDRHLDAGRPVGLQTSVYWLPYFPEDMRFHFNAHNLIVYGREGDDYLISDPVFEHPVRAHRTALMKARFARGPFAPKGLLYYPEVLPESVDWSAATRSAIRRTCMMMRYSPVPWIGVRGIRYLARRLERLPTRRLTTRQQQLMVGQVIRMQEEIGTGGGGFRYLYAAFLQEASGWTGSEALAQAADHMASAGDTWRQFAVQGARFVKSGDEALLASLPDLLRHCADAERATYDLMWHA
jgi:hypothetical protein